MVTFRRVSVHKSLAALPVGALIASGLLSAPTANATCASFFGLGNSPSCTSTPTSIAVAIGTNASAHADGLFGMAFAVGNSANASTLGALDFATAVGDNTSGNAYGLIGIAMGLGPNGYAETLGTGGSPSNLANLGLNVALDVSLGTTVVSGSEAVAIGLGNVAVNLFGNGTTLFGHEVEAIGTLNGAMTLGGTNNVVQALQTGSLNYAFGVFGSNNQVLAGPGPVAIAGSIGQTGASITKQGPGFNINGFRVGGAAATPPATHTTPAAAHSTAAAGGVGHPKSH
jgi:hypothetical protein